MVSLFFGADELQVAEAVATCRARIPADLQDLNIVELDGRKLKLPALAAACEAIPFLSDVRLVIVTGALKHLKAGETRDAIRDYLPSVPPTTELIFAEGDDFDKRSAIFTYLKKAGQVREFQPRQGADLQRWLQERARLLGVRLQGEAGALLTEYVGVDGRALLNELNKLAAYVDEGGTITPDVVRLLVADSGESSVFDFVDALSERRLGPALGQLHALFADGVAATYVLFMVGRQVRLLLGVSELQAQRKGADAIAAELGQRPFVVRKTIGQAGRFDRTALLRLHDRITELDHWSKTGRIEAEAALDLLVGETCAVRPPVEPPRRQEIYRR